MRILHTLSQLPSKTGSGVYYSNMIEGFKKYGYEQKALFVKQDEYKWSVLEDKDQYSIIFKSKELPFPIVGMSDVMPYESSLYSAMTDEMVAQYRQAFKRKLIEVKKHFSPDLIFAHHLWLLTSLVREIFPHTKIIGICHNTDLRQARMNPEFKNKYVKIVDKSDYIFSISDLQQREIVDLYDVDRKKIITVGGGFDQNIFYFPKEKKYSDKVRLVFCGKIDPSKGIYEFIEVYKSLRLEDVTLEIIGNPNKENKKKIDKLIKEDPSINFLSPMKQKDLGDELRKKDIFIMPSFYEGLALMAVESLACGLYVVTTDIDALRSFLGQEVEDSGVITYIPLPGIYDTDKPVKKDLPEFKENLKQAILVQIEKVRKEEKFPREIEDKIKSLSWEGLVKTMNDILISIDLKS